MSERALDPSQDLFIIIVNYNTGAYLRECLRSICSSRRVGDIRVCVVDNGSRDDSVAVVRREFPTVELIVNETNRGYAHANNLGLRSCRSPYALLLNPDTVLPPNALADMMAFMESDPNIGVAGPKLVLDDGSLDLACRRSFPTITNSFYKIFGLSQLFPHSPRLARYNLTYLDPDVVTEVDSVVGAFMMVRGGILEQVGLLDEEFFLYGEDLDWAFRIKAAGWKVYYYPKVQVIHHKGAASHRDRTRVRYEFYRSMYLFYRKHYAESTPLPLHWMVIAGIAVRGGVDLLKEMLRSERRIKARSDRSSEVQQ